MFEGTVVSINIAPEAEAPMQSVGEARAVLFSNRSPIAN